MPLSINGIVNIFAWYFVAIKRIPVSVVPKFIFTIL